MKHIVVAATLLAALAPAALSADTVSISASQTQTIIAELKAELAVLIQELAQAIAAQSGTTASTTLTTNTAAAQVSASTSSPTAHQTPSITSLVPNISSFAAGGNASFTWNTAGNFSQKGSSYALYLKNISGTSSLLVSSAPNIAFPIFNLALPENVTGTTSLEVDYLSSTGATLATGVSPTFTITPPVATSSQSNLSASISSPASGTSVVMGTSTGSVNGNAVGDITFTGNASGGSGSYKYYWDFGDGKASNDTSFQGGSETVSHYYLDPGTYGVRLRVLDSNGINAYSQYTTVSVTLD